MAGPGGTSPLTAAAAAGPSWLRRWALREVAPPAWDGLLRASGAVALAGILVSSLAPRLSELTALFALTLLLNGPHSMLTPVAYEPVLMVFGRLYPPPLVAAVGTVATLMVEYVNYRLYDAALHARLLRGVRESALVRRVVGWFGVRPFLTVFICALTPIPFWIARVVAPLAHYPVRRYLPALALGRFPRLWFYAAMGLVIPFTGAQILAAGAGATVLLAAAIALGRRPSRSE